MANTPPRILRVTYRSGRVRRLASVLVKVPYGGIFAMTEVLSRALSTGDVEWFRVERAKDITVEDRANLVRWPEGLTSTAEHTKVDWLK